MYPGIISVAIHIMGAKNSKYTSFDFNLFHKIKNTIPDAYIIQTKMNILSIFIL